MNAAGSAKAEAARAPAPECDEQELVRRIRAGDARAFESLFQANYQGLCAYAASILRSPERAEDVVHDVLLQVWRTRAQWEVRDDVRSYLYRAVQNRALNVLKREKVAERWRAEAVADMSVAGVGQGPAQADESVRSRQLIAAFEQALADLPERQRQAFLLRWQQRMSYADIAHVMGISEKTVESTLARAGKTLRSDLAGFMSS